MEDSETPVFVLFCFLGCVNLMHIHLTTITVDVGENRRHKVVRKCRDKFLNSLSVGHIHGSVLAKPQKWQNKVLLPALVSCYIFFSLLQNGLSELHFLGHPNSLIKALIKRGSLYPLKEFTVNPFNSFQYEQSNNSVWIIHWMKKQRKLNKTWKERVNWRVCPNWCIWISAYICSALHSDSGGFPNSHTVSFPGWCCLSQRHDSEGGQFANKELGGKIKSGIVDSRRG